MEMRWRYLLTLLVLGVACATDEDSIPDAGVGDSEELSLDQEESRNLRPRAYTPSAYNQLPSGFRPTASLAELAGYQQRQQVQPVQEQEEYVIQPRPTPQQYVEEPRPQVQRVVQRKPDQRPARLQQRPIQEVEEELEDEKEEPDRLSELLQQSKFNCVSKQTGYYADEELNCEVFHYCQDNVKHSWICPEGFTFHQVHLICMPPTHDNICQRSSKYHFVNDYLYRPINEEEVSRKPNVSLKYSDRYYPSEVYRDDRYEQEEQDEEEAPRRQPAPAQLQARPNVRPQVFRSAEEVNIPLVQRRPQRPYDFDF